MSKKKKIVIGASILTVILLGVLRVTVIEPAMKPSVSGPHAIPERSQLDVEFNINN